MGKAKNFAVGTVIAAAAGYVAGILTAPKSGKETREDIKDVASKSYIEAEKQLKKIHTELNTVIADAKSKGQDLNERTRKELDVLVEKSKVSKEKVRDMLSALHEGSADDKDLKKAIQDATQALEHLRTYLTK